MANIHLCPNNVHPLDFAISVAVRVCDQRPAEQPLDLVLVYGGLEAAASKAVRRYDGREVDFACKFVAAIRGAAVAGMEGLLPPPGHPDYSTLLSSLTCTIVDAAAAGPEWDFVLWDSINPRLVHLVDARHGRAGFFRHAFAEDVRQSLLSRELLTRAMVKSRDRLLLRIDSALAGVVFPEMIHSEWDSSDEDSDEESYEGADSELSDCDRADPSAGS